MAPKKVVIFTDGASRGNPGPAAIGVVIQDEIGQILETISLCLGKATNNQAEYRAMIAGLEKARDIGATGVEICSDSELVVRQLSGEYKVKNASLTPLYLKTQQLCRSFSSFKVNYIPREKNAKADKLANMALDCQKSQEKPLAVSATHTRRATQDDYPAMLGIFMELEKQHVEGVPDFFRIMSHEEQVKEFDSAMADDHAVLMVAERGAEVLGFIYLKIKEPEVGSMLRPRRFVKISYLCVASRFHRSGAGMALLAAAEHWAAERGIEAIDLNVWDFNRGAAAFYEKMGFKTVSCRMWKHV